MPRFRLAIVPLSVLLILGCTSKDIEPLPPAEVLSRAARVSQSLESARYSMDADFFLKGADGSSLEGNADINGMLTNGGNQVSFTVALQADAIQEGASFTLNGTLDVVVASPSEVYVNLRSLQTSPAGTFFHPGLVSLFQDTWWVLPSETGAPADPKNITPDPRLLHAQSQVVTVTRDRGLSTLGSTGDRPVYHYDVTIDQEKLIAYMKALAEEEGQPFDEAASREQFGQLEANGQIWIDAETFALHRLQWHVPMLSLEGGSEASLSFQVDLRDHNSTLTIAPPKDAVPFSPQNLLSGTLPVKADAILEEQNSSEESLGDILRSIRN